LGNIDTRVSEYLKRSRRKSIWKQIVKGMSCVVVFCTVYALILPAITAQTGVYCGKEEHTHTQECYVQVSQPPQGQLICTPESLGVHVHQDACYDASGKLSCGQADYVVHSHNEFCYDPEGNLICSLEERSQHVHDESCYMAVEPENQPTIPEHIHTEECYERERGALICTQEGVEEHTHTETCYVPGEKLTCGREETEGHIHGEECAVRSLICAAAAAENHEHGPECYQTHQICTREETQGHAHSDSCWGRNQICGQEENEEHTHDDGCFETVLLCTMEEQEPHTHGEACFEQVLSCQAAAAVEGHVHDESCYQTTVICELEEQEPHTHSDACYEPVLDCQVHVHTDVPGEVLTESMKYGVLELVKIENMRTQYEDMAAGRAPQSTDDLDMAQAEQAAEPAVAAPEKKYGVVSVCAGEGLASVFRDLGADGIIQGGQTMNPSTDDIVRQINRTPAEVVFVLPNNKNIIMAAEQTVRFTEKKVIVIPSKTVPQGITAMLNFDPEQDEEANAAAMTEAMAGVSTMQITYAARNSDFDGHEIHEGDYLGLYNGSLMDTTPDVKLLLTEMAKRVSETGAEFINIFYGADINEAQAQDALNLFSEHCPAAEINLLNGGQPVYYYLISAE